MVARSQRLPLALLVAAAAGVGVCCFGPDVRLPPALGGVPLPSAGAIVGGSAALALAGLSALRSRRSGPPKVRLNRVDLFVSSGSLTFEPIRINGTWRLTVAHAGSAAVVSLDRVGDGPAAALPTIHRTARVDAGSGGAVEYWTEEPGPAELRLRVAVTYRRPLRPPPAPKGGRPPPTHAAHLRTVITVSGDCRVEAFPAKPMWEESSAGFPVRLLDGDAGEAAAEPPD